MSDLLYHKVSASESAKIKKQAKEILDNFSKKLSSVNKKISEQSIKRPSSDRAENTKSDENFSRDIMFDNALHKNKDFIIAEKKKW